MQPLTGVISICLISPSPISIECHQRLHGAYFQVVQDVHGAIECQWQCLPGRCRCVLALHRVPSTVCWKAPAALRLVMQPLTGVISICLISPSPISIECLQLLHGACFQVVQDAHGAIDMAVAMLTWKVALCLSVTSGSMYAHGFITRFNAKAIWLALPGNGNDNLMRLSGILDCSSDYMVVRQQHYEVVMSAHCHKSVFVLI